jgi:arsenate reductase-like glutaredoxin family protein
MTTIQAQIFGFTDCQDTRKAQPSSRSAASPSLVDLRDARRGRFPTVRRKFGAAALIDREGARYKALGLRVALDSPERLLERALTEPRLLRTPLVRCGGRVGIGHAPDVWQEWLETAKQGGGKPA